MITTPDALPDKTVTIGVVVYGIIIIILWIIWRVNQSDKKIYIYL